MGYYSPIKKELGLYTNISPVEKESLVGLSSSIFVKGSTATVEGIDKISQNLKEMFSTIPGQRFFEPWYGFTGWQYVFEPNDFIFEDLIKYHIRESIKACEPRVEVVSIETQQYRNVNSCLFRITLRVIDLGTEFEYPFYVNRR